LLILLNGIKIIIIKNLFDKFSGSLNKDRRVIIMFFSTLFNPSVADQLTQRLTYPAQKQLFEALIFLTREKIIDNLVREISNIIIDSHSSHLTAEDIGSQLTRRYKWLKETHKFSPLTPREEQFRTYITEQVISIVKAPTPTHLQRQILDVMDPVDRSMIEFMATKPACHLLAILDERNSQIVDDLFRKEKCYH
jgi:hypothetical protein